MKDYDVLVALFEREFIKYTNKIIFSLKLLSPILLVLEYYILIPLAHFEAATMLIYWFSLKETISNKKDCRMSYYNRSYSLLKYQKNSIKRQFNISIKISNYKMLRIFNLNLLH